MATTYEEISNAFKVDARTVGYWRRKGAPIVAFGKNDLAEIAKWRSTYLDEKSTMGAGTSNHYVTALRGFGKWLVKHAKRCDTNPFENLDKIDARGDVRKDRRVLSPIDFAALIAAATASRDSFRELTGEDRAIIYTLAAYTGLRAGEIGSLKTSSFDLASRNPTVTVRPAYTKNSEIAVLPLRSDLVVRLQTYIGSRQPATLSMIPKSALIWPSNWSEVGAEMIRVDLAAAGITYTDDDGRDYDFHALRHQFITGLAEAGVHPKKAQALARHSKIDLTMDHYTKIDIHDAAADVERLGAIPTGQPPEHARATGTDDTRVTPSDYQKRILPKRKPSDSNSVATSLATSLLSNEGILSDKADSEKNSLPDRSIKKARQKQGFARLSSAPPVGLEPTTNGLTVRRSTN